ncbi:bifunctional glutamate N-acetyltransferase/amino-acid acetyltransferase ArgJ [Candidatus Haliotispira prima]|uniref:Arginine biosynthesis bifunctional protein ArgJ n=1 Tax=Candidatus Haliotispira prima TaxID=3034016 RepID=A0ABY8MKR1_9SPIO|nr:bifunctional glutamate N-acetyltransferase/amino-acid acetyltransferase ArgJ [Candidatus Haliotispira prima]
MDKEKATGNRNSPVWTKQSNGMINTPQGFLATGIHAGFRRDSGRLDLGSIYSECPAQAAGVFTRNQFCGSHVTVTRKALEQSGGVLQGLICNSGQANTGTGKRGIEVAQNTQMLYQEKMSIRNPEWVGVFSTGVIGILPDMDRCRRGIENLQLSKNPKDGSDFSRAILTTDRVAKTSCYVMEIDGRSVTLSGNAKGSGMIHPNMATMLAFITTDAAIEEGRLRPLLGQCVDRSFHRISVDGDTSTNDSVLIMANGMAGNRPLNPEHPDWGTFCDALQALCLDMAYAIVRDAEGAHKFIEVEVFGAPNEENAAWCAKGVISSNLFKAAMYGEDMNWGRINSALGAAVTEHHLAIDFSRLDLTAGKGEDAIPLMRAGELLEHSERDAAALLSQPNIYFAIDLHCGSESAKAWGCDLSYDYIHINAIKRS